MKPKRNSVSAFEKVKRAWDSASPLAVQIALMSLFITYILASLPWFSSWPWFQFLSNRPQHDALIGVCFFLGFLAFTTLLSASKSDPKQPLGGRMVRSEQIGEVLTAFLDQSRLDLDLFAYTAETFREPLNTFFVAFQKTSNPPKQVHFRILVKDWRDATSFLPGCERTATDEIRIQRRAYRIDQARHQRKMYEELKSIFSNAGKSLPVTVEFKVYHIDPFHKGILVNRHHGFWNLYPIEIGISQKHPNILDYHGTSVELGEFRQDGNKAEAIAVLAMSRWFDEVWTTCCSSVPVD